jgi:hypothetical protein
LATQLRVKSAPIKKVFFFKLQPEKFFRHTIGEDYAKDFPDVKS